MSFETETIGTADGACAAYVCAPNGGGPWPAAILYMDAGGIRPAALEMAEHLAGAGYVVLLPDPFYRYGPYGPLVPKDVFAGDVGAILGPLMSTTNNAKAARDTEAFLAYLDTRKDVIGKKVGAVGFCMGGGMAIASAGAYPHRFAAVASFHGGNLATDESTSPHLAAPHLKADVYVASAANDDSYPPAMAETFEHTLTENGVRFRAETYPAAHGWMVPDFPVFDEAAATRGWRELIDFFARNLQPRTL
jgi:carboxymethylenebutenolidase